MGRVITKRFQTCDFCQKEYELSRECEERLRQAIEPYPSLELRDLVVNVNGTTEGHSQIEWKEEKPE